jgi:hypothetical protein
MQKHAALTALAIALITMLTLAVSASVTPANAGVCPRSADQATAWAHMFGVSPSLMLESYCFCRCYGDYVRRRINTETSTSNGTKLQACQSKCVNTFEASRR